MSKRLVFFGTEDFSLPSLEALVEAGYDIAAVVTKSDTKRGRNQQLTPPAVKQYAAQHSIPVLQPIKLGEHVDELKMLSADGAVLVSYGKILPKRILDVFEPIGIINIHPSLLPKYRGPSPIEAAILNGDTSTGISIMKLTEGMDEGPLYLQTTYPLHGDETKPQLYKTLAKLGAIELLKVLPDILSGTLVPKVQKNSDVSVTSLISKDLGKADHSTDTAEAIERKVRAYLGYPKTRLSYGDNDVIITSAKVVDSPQPNTLTIPCANNTYLRVDELIAPSGKIMSGADYLRGYAA